MASKQVGDIRIDVASEMMIDDGFPANVLVPSIDMAVVEANRALLVPFCYNEATGGLKLSIHTWVVRHAGKTILIDTCNGNDKNRPGFELAHQLHLPYLERLAAVGVKPEEVDMVMCTHLHVDHCGWNTCLKDGKWVPTFPNARYLFSRQELDQWTPGSPSYAPAEINQNVLEDSVLPVIEAGLVDLIDGDRDLEEGMRIELAPGHTNGSIVLKMNSKGRHAMFVGDTMHSPVQVLRPEWSSGFCLDPVRSAQTRRKLVEFAADHDALLMPAHFPPPHAVRVKRAGEHFTFTAE
jgi:glyoxylase-like metal-dependent hydrolase (beta-lactamase superfamily II)